MSTSSRTIGSKVYHYGKSESNIEKTTVYNPKRKEAARYRINCNLGHHLISSYSYRVGLWQHRLWSLNMGDTKLVKLLLPNNL